MSDAVQPLPKPRRQTRWWFYPVAAVCVAAGAVFLYFVPPTETTWWYPKCYLHLLTGLHCPGCGATRSVAALARGDLEQAAAFNVLFVLLLPPFAGWLLLRQLAEWTGRRWLRVRLPTWLIYSLLVVAGVYGVLRNLPVEPFSQLAPHELKR